MTQDYVGQLPDLLKRFDGYTPQIQSIVRQSFSNSDVEVIIKETRDEFERLVPEIQFIGHKNIFRYNLIDTTMLLALYRSLSKRGTDLPEYGKMIYDIAMKITRSSEGLKTRITRRLMFTRFGKSIFRRAAERSQLRKYPGDWVFEVVEGDGVNFDLGLNVYECGILKFLKSQNAEEIGPYLCLMDFVFAQAKGSGLKRTMTLTEGGEKCDFRWKKGGETKDAWPPP